MRKSAVICAVLASIALAGCQTTKVEIAKPCGVIRDSLKSVDAKSRDGQRRLAVHYARGRAAGCWS